MDIFKSFRNKKGFVGCLSIISQQGLKTFSVSQPWMALRLFSEVSRLIFDKIRTFCLCAHCMLWNSSVLLWQWRLNFLNGCLVIYIGDSSMLMQETVNSFEEVMQTKLKVKRCISQSSTEDLLFKQKFSSPTLDFSLDFAVFVRYLNFFAFGCITNNAFWEQSAELYLKSIVS